MALRHLPMTNRSSERRRVAVAVDHGEVERAIRVPCGDDSAGRDWTERRLGLVGLGIAVALGTTLVLAHPATDWRGQADEGTYARYAERVAAEGPSAFPTMVREYLDDPQQWATQPPPLRLSAIVPDALAVRWLGAGAAS